MKAGDTVRYSRPADDLEREFLFVIVDGPHDGRVSIKWINSGFRIAPIETVAINEVALATGGDSASTVMTDGRHA